jgi:menaquinone-dependent protoporphyrinogen oxidase
MPERILIGYAGQRGSTGEIADAIAKVMRDNHTVVVVRPFEQISDLSSYQAVIIGSAIYDKQWMPPAMAFLKANQDTLSRMPVALFSVCLTACEKGEEGRRKVMEFMESARQAAPSIVPKDIGIFAGVMDYGKWSFPMRIKIKSSYKWPEGDFRDWEAIRSWGESVHPLLMV